MYFFFTIVIHIHKNHLQCDTLCEFMQMTVKVKITGLHFLSLFFALSHGIFSSHPVSPAEPPPLLLAPRTRPLENRCSHAGKRQSVANVPPLRNFDISFRFSREASCRAGARAREHHCSCITVLCMFIYTTYSIVHHHEYLDGYFGCERKIVLYFLSLL